MTELHNCDLPKSTKVGAWGMAIDTCFEDAHGLLWVDNGEYANTVNFCPVCGYQAQERSNEVESVSLLQAMRRR